MAAVELTKQKKKNISVTVSLRFAVDMIVKCDEYI